MIKKLLAVLLMAAVAAFPAGCTQRDTETFTIQDFFPRNENKLAFYEGGAEFNRTNPETGESYIENTDFYLVCFQDYIRGEKNQQRTLAWVNGEQSSYAEVYGIKDGELRLTHTQGNFLDHMDLTAEPDNDYMLILKEPLKIGSKWTRYYYGDSSVNAEIISMNTEVTVPYGTFEAMVVKTTDSSRNETTLEYFVKDVGLVKIEQENPSKTQYQQLTGIDEGLLTEYMELFYEWDIVTELDDEGGEHYSLRPNYDVDYIEYPTNGDICEIYTEFARRYILERYEYEIGADVKINGFEFDRLNKQLTVDMSAAFLDEMANTGAMEKQYLQLLADNIGWTFNAVEVTFTINGGAYVSDNVTLNPGDYILMSMYCPAEDYLK